MGVPGLTTFIDTRARQLLTDVKLSNIRLIIDGNNLYHFLYYHYKVRHECAGDYDEFDRACSAFFETLHSCAIEPFVVFDGAHAEDGRKFKVSLSRAAERIHLAGFLSHGHRGKILPILAYEVFVRQLDAARVPHVTCYLEADAEIAALAKEWNCPVLTNDSDFFIYDLPAGVVLLDYLNLNVHRHRIENMTCNKLSSSRQSSKNENNKSGKDKLGSEINDSSTKIAENVSISIDADNSVKVSSTNEQITKSECKPAIAHNYLNVQVFYCDKLLALYKLQDRKMLAFAATLLGNDVVNRKHFENFYAKARLVKQSAKRQGSKAGVAASMFQWLKDRDSIEEAFNEVLLSINESKRDSVKTLLETSIDSYSVKNCTLVDYMESVNGRFSTENSSDSVNSLEFQISAVRIDSVLSNTCQQLPSFRTVTEEKASEISSSEITQQLNASQSSRHHNENLAAISSSSIDVGDSSSRIHCNEDLASSLLLEHDARNVSNRIPAQLPQPLPLSRGGNQLPHWFLEAVCAGRIPSRALSAIMRRCVILLAQVEVSSFPSAYECALALRQCFYSILLSIDAVQNEESMFVAEHDRDQKNIQKKKVATIEFLSKGKRIPKLCDIQTMPYEVKFEFLVAALLDMVVVSRNKRERLDELPIDLRLIVLTLVYWIAHSKPAVTIINMKSLLLCHLCLGALDGWIINGGESLNAGLLNAEEKSPSGDLSNDKLEVQNMSDEKVTMQKVSNNKVSSKVASVKLVTNNKQKRQIIKHNTAEVELKELKLTLLDRFNQVPSVNNAHKFDGRLIHAYSQYQACLQATIHLHQLLLLQQAIHWSSTTFDSVHVASLATLNPISLVSPVSSNPLIKESPTSKILESQTSENTKNLTSESPTMKFSASLNPAALFNGTFLYNLSRELEDRVNPDLYIQQLLKRDTQICRRYHELVDIILSVVPAPYFESAALKQGAKRSKKNSTNNVESCIVENDSVSNTVSDADIGARYFESDAEKQDMKKTNMVSRRNVEHSIFENDSSDNIMPSDDNDARSSSDSDDFADSNNRFAFLRLSSDISI